MHFKLKGSFSFYSSKTRWGVYIRLACANQMLSLSLKIGKDTRGLISAESHKTTTNKDHRKRNKVVRKVSQQKKQLIKLIKQM